MAEKRWVKLLGKARAGNGESQQLELLDWINRSEPNESIPEKAKFRNNLPTVSNRLKDLILDALRLLNKEVDNDALLRTTLDEMGTLYRKGLYPSALKQSRRAKRLALSCCRYSQALHCIEWEQILLQSENGTGKLEALAELRQEEIHVIKQIETLRELHFRHESLRYRAAQLSFTRDGATQDEIRALAAGEMVQQMSETGNYLERALAVNILGIRDLLLRDPLPALTRYAQLFDEWKAHPEWQSDQATLLLYMCRMYQNTCFHSNISWNEAQAYLARIRDFGSVASEQGRDFPRLLYHNQLSLALNLGNFEAAKNLIPEIDGWLSEAAAHLPESLVLPFLHNFAVVEFIHGEFAAANRFVNRILNLPNPKARIDIRDFALLFRAIIQYELGNEGLDEYLTRAGKRHFSKTSREFEFELAVFRYLDKTLRVAHPSELSEPLDQLSQILDRLLEHAPGEVPVLGLNEVKLWVKAKQRGVPLREVFLEAVQENMAGLG